jgi:hypothetical protein
VDETTSIREKKHMARVLSVLAAALALLAAPTAASAQSINPPPTPGPGQLACAGCPADLVASTSRHFAPVTGIPYWQVEITNVGGQTAPASTATVRFWPPGTLNGYETTVAVDPLAAGQTRVVFWISFASWSPEACADSAGAVRERNESNNCT